jgi:hypothetical protein
MNIVEALQKKLPLNKVIDYFVEYNIQHSSTASRQMQFAYIGTKNITSDNFGKNIIDISLADLLGYAINKEITIFGQKTLTISNIQPLSSEDITTDPWFYQESWSNNYSSVYDKGKLLYINLQVKKADLKQLIEKYKIS